MNISLLSDLHLEHLGYCEEYSMKESGDILILAGDILCAKHLKATGPLNDLYRKFLTDCSGNFEHVIYVPGNHEFYGYNYNSTFKRLKESIPSNFTLLNNESKKIGNWTFIGFTFWTNFRNGNPLDMIEAARILNDYKCIRIGNNYRKLRPDDTFNFNIKSRNYLTEQLKVLDGNIFVISHHSPSYRSVPEQYKTSKINSAYCNDMDEYIIDHPQIKYWAHGHIHSVQDYNIDHCRVICNPGGYIGEITGHNPSHKIRI